jgi:hypothetical protein
VIVQTDISLNGKIGGAPVKAKFEPALTFTLDLQQLRLGGTVAAPTANPDADPNAPIIRTQTKSVTIPDTTEGRVPVPILHAELPVWPTRIIGLAGGLLLLLAAALGERANVRHAAAVGEVGEIVRRLGDKLIPADASSPPPGRTVVTVTSINGLTRIAERYERFILHSSQGEQHTFLVDDDTALYLYQARGLNVRSGGHGHRAGDVLPHAHPITSIPLARSATPPDPAAADLAPDPTAPDSTTPDVTASDSTATDLGAADETAANPITPTNPTATATAAEQTDTAAADDLPDEANREAAPPEADNSPDDADEPFTPTDESSPIRAGPPGDAAPDPATKPPRPRIPGPRQAALGERQWLKTRAHE